MLHYLHKLLEKKKEKRIKEGHCKQPHICTFSSLNSCLGAVFCLKQAGSDDEPCNLFYLSFKFLLV